MFDLAIDKATGDWLFSPNIDLQGINGDDVVKQRIFMRLKIQRGWINDPSDGLLGSRLRLGLRSPRDRAIVEIPLFIREALAPMVDVSVNDIQLEESGTASIIARIFYSSLDPGDPRPLDTQASEDIAIEIPI